MMSSPIPTDPMYAKSMGGGGWSARDYAPQPRVRPEAKSIADMHKGSVGRLMTEMYQPPSYQRPASRQKPDSKDFSKENVRHLREIQRLNRRRQSEEEYKSSQPVKALPQSKKYETVPSKLADHLSAPPPAPRPESANYLRAHSRTGSHSSMSNGRRSPSPSRPASVTKDLEKLKLSGQPVDYVALNARHVKHFKIQRSPSATMLDDFKSRKEQELKEYRKGHVPNYLVKRQNQWRKDYEEYKANEPDPSLPPGHKVMPDRERRDTLEVLKQKERELSGEMARLPVTADTLRARQKRAEVEGKMAEIEEAIKIFSRPKVFIKIDS